jgi:hypothetical protein
MVTNKQMLCRFQGIYYYYMNAFSKQIHDCVINGLDLARWPKAAGDCRGIE